MSSYVLVPFFLTIFSKGTTFSLGSKKFLIQILLLANLKGLLWSQTPVVHVCNPSYLGG
jgi:hypothetical protein